MRKFKFKILLSLLLCLLFCSQVLLPVSAEGSDDNLLTLSNLSDSRLIKSGNATVSNGVVTVPAGGSYSAYIRVNPVSATRKYKFTYYYRCSSAVGSSFSLAGSVKIYYKDSSTGSELSVLELAKFTNADIQRSNTLTMPDNFGDAGRIYFVFKNTSNSSVSIRVDNFIVNDMTTADLDSSLGKLGDRIKGFFEDLANTIKGFFIPEEGFFDTVKQKFETLLSEHLGFLYQAPAMVTKIIQLFVDWQPSETPYLDFPAVDFDVAGTHVHLWDKVHYTFDFLQNAPFSTLYAFYKTLVFCIVSLAMVNLAIKKYHNIIGGGSDDN